ncbi:cytochrome P450 3A6 [Trichonephila clavipes]|nr:cytochrome P450 3A6 [Trichonephila clavipes]
MVSTLRGEDWKRVRSIITPTFTTGKLKRMLGIFKECSETLMKNFENTMKEGKPIDAKRLYGTLTMDVIASAAFSTKIDSHNDPDNEFVKTARDTFSGNRSYKFLILLLLPFLPNGLKRMLFSRGSTHFFRDTTFQIIKNRKRTGQGQTVNQYYSIEVLKRPGQKTRGKGPRRGLMDCCCIKAMHPLPQLHLFLPSENTTVMRPPPHPPDFAPFISYA